MNKTSNKINNLARALLILTLLFTISSPYARASTLDPFSSDFKLSICDGPEGLNHINPTTGKIDRDPTTNAYLTTVDPNYVPCDFAGLMKQAQFLINAMIMLGVLAAIFSFTYAGILYISGEPSKISQAHKIFKNVGIGFIMMISAWFIVYQLLTWLQVNDGVKVLLGNP